LALTNYNVGTRMYDKNLKSRNNNIRRHRHIIRSSNYFCLIIIMADMEGGGVSRLSDCIIQHQSWYRLPPPISFKPLIFSKTFFQLSFFGVRISSLYLQEYTYQDTAFVDYEFSPFAFKVWCFDFIKVRSGFKC